MVVSIIDAAGLRTLLHSARSPLEPQAAAVDSEGSPARAPDQHKDIALQHAPCQRPCPKLSDVQATPTDELAAAPRIVPSLAV